MSSCVGLSGEPRRAHAAASEGSRRALRVVSNACSGARRTTSPATEVGESAMCVQGLAQDEGRNMEWRRLYAVLCCRSVAHPAPGPARPQCPASPVPRRRPQRRSGERRSAGGSVRCSGLLYVVMQRATGFKMRGPNQLPAVRHHAGLAWDARAVEAARRPGHSPAAPTRSRQGPFPPPPRRRRTLAANTRGL